HIYKIDMTNVVKESFESILERFYHGIQPTTSTMFVIDEVDKYLDYRIKIGYDQLKERKSKEKVENVTIQTFEEYQQQEKITFLYHMLSILERDGLEHPVIVIFCSNNFHSIFEGVDLTHYESLYDRFLKVNFGKCHFQEI